MNRFQYRRVVCIGITMWLALVGVARTPADAKVSTELVPVQVEIPRS